MKKGGKLKILICAALLLVVVSLFAELSREQRIANMPKSSVILEPPRERPMLAPVPYFEDFEGASAGWTTWPYTMYCQWQWMLDPELIAVHDTIYGSMVELGDPRPAYLPEPHSGNACFWYGSPENGTFIGNPFDMDPLGGAYHSGGNSFEDHGGTLTSPLFETSTLSRIMFSFWTWWEVECIDIDNFDSMAVDLSTDGGATWEALFGLNPPFSRLPGWEHWQAYSSGGYLAPGIWIKWTYFLDSEVSGHDIMLRFRFETEDGLYNGFRGWFVDDIYVGGGLEEAQLIRTAEYQNPLDLIDCAPSPNPFPFDFIVENIGGEAAHDVVLVLDLPDILDIQTGIEIVPMGDVLSGDCDTIHWDLHLNTVPTSDTTICWHVLLNSADSLIGYHDDFEGEERLFTGDSYFDYCDVRLPNGPDTCISGFGIAGLPADGSMEYSGGIESHLTSSELYLDGWTEAYLAFSYWLSVPPIDPFSFSGDGEDGFLLEININHDGWTHLDEFGVGILLPRYDGYIDEWTDNPLSDRMTYCDSTGEWVSVASQDLIDMGVVTPGDTLQVRFVFGSDSWNHAEGIFIDEFRVSTVQHPIGPFQHTLCMDVPGAHYPDPSIVMPMDSSSSSCPDQQIILNAGPEAILDSTRVIIWVDSLRRFSLDNENLHVESSSGVIIAQPLTGNYWSEGWHHLALDTCYNILGCNIVEPLYWNFLSDLTPPGATLLDPIDSMISGDNFYPVTIELTDSLTGVEDSTISLVFCGNEYSIDHSALDWDGTNLVFYPESTGTGCGWYECPEICIIAGDDPDYCDPNMDTTCFPIDIVFENPIAQVVTPLTGQVTACEDQQIVLALFDEYGIDPDGAVLEVEGISYETGIDTEVEIVNETLTFTPSVMFTHGQTIEFSLLELYNTFGENLLSPVSSSFEVDLQEPIIDLIEPQPFTLVSDINQIMHIDISDIPAGLDLSTLIIDYGDQNFDFDDVVWTPSGNGGRVTIDPSQMDFEFEMGGTIQVEIAICDSPDLCPPNCGSYQCEIYLEPKTSCAAWPNPFSPNNDNINDRIYFDYPHRYINNAEIYIYDLNNNLIFKRELSNSRGLDWTGIDNDNRVVAPGLYMYIIKSENRVVCSGTLILVK